MGQINTDQKKDEIFISTCKSLPNDYKEKIINLLKKNNSGLTIADIAKKIGTTRHTASIILAELRGANLIEIRNVGMAKLHNWRDIKS
ncbi:MarR family transcriptional regulator [Candidatus Woesearchaeota archaeon]|nr:MarR family transcriptional regulator [Candidatus Woesearchaeota archaeon]